MHAQRIHESRTGSNTPLLLGQIVLLPDGLHQHLERFDLPFRQQPKLGAEEHEMLETGVEMGCHSQRFEGSEETRVNNAIHAEQPSEDLSAEGGKLWRLEDAQGLGLIVVVGKFGLVINLLRYPMQHLFNVNWGRNADGLRIAAGALRPAVLDTGGEPLAGSEGRQVGIAGHHRPDGRYVIVKIDSVDCHPTCAGLSRRKGNLV
mmetsp:Transcript_18850/g.54338  ORF Transcript_18850/g.54338 Transcript_18850/m.54338 type:complete len:204 (-) Transcript_18850:662-1273(-)